jgi:hypothetical protein
MQHILRNAQQFDRYGDSITGAKKVNVKVIGQELIALDFERRQEALLRFGNVWRRSREPVRANGYLRERKSRVTTR